MAYEKPSSPEYAANPQRRHTRGRRGRITTGITDLQNDFEIEALKDDRGATRYANKQRGRRRQSLSDQKKRAEKAFRGKTRSTKVSKIQRDAPATSIVRGVRAMNAQERAEFVRQKARKRRVGLGLEGKSRAQRRANVTSSSTASSVFNLTAAVTIFKRSGRLPQVSLDTVQAADASGLDARALKRMINAMLVRAGVEENPGPPSSHESDPPCTTSSTTTTSSSTCSSEWRVKSSAKQDRADEKKTKCGGFEPKEKERLDTKKHRGRANFAGASLLQSAHMLEQDQKAGQKDADKEKAIDEQERMSSHMREMFMDERPAFIMRSGGFARAWYFGFGVPTTRARLAFTMLTYVQVWFQWIIGRGDLPLWDPRDGAAWRPLGVEDREYMTPTFKGLVFSVVGIVILAIVFFSCTAFVWLVSFSSLLNWIAYVVTLVIRTGAIVQIFAMVFRPVLRYMPEDRMAEFSRARPLSSDPDFESTMRMSGSRYRPATDAAVLANVDVLNVTVADRASWYQKYWATSWLFGSLFTWLETNRLITLVEERAHYVVSLRIVDTILCGLTRSRLDSYLDAESKARNIVSSYDELQLGIQQVRGRNVREDSIRYAAALYWSKAAADASLGNGVIPHSD